MTSQQFLFSAWHWQPLALAVAGAAVWAYVAAVRKAKVRGPKAELSPNAPRPSAFGFLSALGLRPSAFFLLALVLFLGTLLSPLDALADGYLFSAHMLQHLLLLLVVPPLALLAWPRVPNPPFALPPSHFPLRTLGSWLSGVGAMWFWHVPTLCNAATANPVVRSIQTLSLLGLGTLFWLPILSPTHRHRLAPLGGVLYLFTACVGCTLLGILITFAPISVCSIYMHPADRLGILPLIRQRWGLTPSVDQQVGGLLMWVPACLIYLCAILSLLAHWYSATEPEAAPAPPGTAPGAGYQSA